MIGLQLIESRPSGANSIPIALNHFPITIGRGNATYRVATGDDWPVNYRNNISRIQATIVRQHGQMWLKDGGQRPSANGIYVAGRKIHRPIKLRPGAEIELSLEIDGCSLKLVWPPDKIEPYEEHPTLQFERSEVGAELDWSQGKVAQLEALITAQNERINALISRQKNQAVRLKQELAARRQNDALQDVRLARLKRAQWVVCGVVGAASVVLIGWDIETLDKVIGGILAVTSILAVAANDR